MRLGGIGDVILTEVAFHSLGLLLDAAQGSDGGAGEGQFVPGRSSFSDVLLQVGVEQLVRVQLRRVTGKIEDGDLLLVVRKPSLHRLRGMHAQVIQEIRKTLFSRPCTRRFMKPIRIFAFSAPEKTFQRICPLLVTVEITLSFERLALASTTGVLPFGA